MSSFEITMPDYYQQKRNIPRFPPDLDDHEMNEIIKYFRNQSIKALHAGVSWNGVVEDIDGWGAKTTFMHDNKSYISIYVYLSSRNHRHMSVYMESNKHIRFCTTPSCELEAFFQKKGVEYVVLRDYPSIEYEMIKQYYGETCTDRTGLHMMNHIDEGLYILESIGASENAKRAYIGHPLV